MRRVKELSLLVLGLALFLSCQSGGPLSPEKQVKGALKKIAGNEMRPHVFFLASDLLKGRDIGSPGGKEAADYIARMFKAIGLKPLAENNSYLQEFTGRSMYEESRHPGSLSGKSPKLNLRNVVGYLEGSDPDLKDEAVVIGAHFDHIGLGEVGGRGDFAGQVHNGADDNASGVASLIVLAGAFASLEQKPGRSIIFIAFDGEEKGLLGAGYYVDHPLWPLDKTVYIVNIDTVGRLRRSKLYVFGAGTSPGSREALEKLNREGFGLNLQFGGLGAAGDQMRFYLKKIPYAFFHTGPHLDYHRPTDDADKINFSGMEKLSRFVFKYILRVINDADRPPYKNIPIERSQGRPTKRPSLGIIPDFGGSDQGLKISGARPGSPAGKAGLKNGDIIIRMDEKTITNIRDLAMFLGSKKAGDEILIIALRAGQEKEFKVKLIGSRGK